MFLADVWSLELESVRVDLVEECHPVFVFEHVVCQQLCYIPLDPIRRRVRTLSCASMRDLDGFLCDIDIDVFYMNSLSLLSMFCT